MIDCLCAFSAVALFICFEGKGRSSFAFSLMHRNASAPSWNALFRPYGNSRVRAPACVLSLLIHLNVACFVLFLHFLRCCVSGVIHVVLQFCLSSIAGLGMLVAFEWRQGVLSCWSVSLVSEVMQAWAHMYICFQFGGDHGCVASAILQSRVFDGSFRLRCSVQTTCASFVLL